MTGGRIVRWCAAGVLTAHLAAVAAPALERVTTVETDWGAHDYRLDLGGTAWTTRNWSWPGWNGFSCALSNGTLTVTGKWALKHGQVDLFPGARLVFAPETDTAKAGEFNPGAGDAAPRRTIIHPGAELDLNGARFTAFNGSIDVKKGATLRLSPKYAGYHWNQQQFPIRVEGALAMPNGFVLTGGVGGAFAFDFAPESAVTVGGDVSNGATKTKVTVTVRGGTMRVTDDSVWEIDDGFIDTNAVWRVDVAAGKVCDLSAFRLAPGAKIESVGKGLVIRSHDDPRWKKAETRLRLAKLDFTVSGDSANRCWFVTWPERFTNVVKSVTYHCPDNDTVTTHLPYFHRRYPANGGKPFTVKAVIEAQDGTVVTKSLPVAFNPHPIGKPLPNEKVLIGMVSYGPGRERHEMVTNDLGNLYVRWSSWQQLLPENAGEDWLREAEKKGIYSMTIYANCPRDKREEIKRAWKGRYLGNNIGEYTGFLYGHRNEMRGPQLHGQTLGDSREWFVSKFIRNRQRFSRGAEGEDPFFFATSGASAASAEMEGGVDFVCNELYAVGCGNILYAQSEARGAARKWGPEWLCGWLAHEWQTFGIPYASDDKYLSLEAGMKGLYVLGTSLMCLESGSSGTQAHPHTAGGERDADGKKKGYNYDDEPCRRYRETVRKVYQWVKENPRDKGLPETRIALALGQNDPYIGYHSRDIAPWGQHTNRIDHLDQKPNIWGGSDPEENWAMTRGVFFPGCGTAGVSGTPFGQVDIMVVDDQSRLSDLARYRLLVFGGWNTATARQRKVLLDWVKGGGTLVMARPQLSTRDDRDFLNYTDQNVLPLYKGAGEPSGVEGVELKRVGKGRIYLSTRHEFPVKKAAFAKQWCEMLRRLAAEVDQTIRLAPVSDRDDTRFITYGVYQTKAYILNLDMHTPRTVRLLRKGVRAETLTLAPLEIRTLTL